MDTHYFTWWVEVVPLRKVNEDAVINFLQENIMTRLGVPISLVFDNASYLSSLKITKFFMKRELNYIIQQIIILKEMG